MKKLAVLFLVLIMTMSSCFAWGWKKKDTSKVDTSQVEVQPDGHGYVGTLPDVSKNFKTNEPKVSKPLVEATKDFNSSQEIKPIPRENPAFVNIILKQDKTSPYINELNEDILPQLENLLLCIEKKYDVQKFNAKAYFFNKSIEYLTEKYNGKPESHFVSFIKLQELSSHTKSIATLREEAEKYKPYLAYTGAGYLYNGNVIDQQLDYLKTEIEETIVIVKEAR